MEKILTIDGRQVRFKSTAALPYQYAAQFGRDIFADMVDIGADRAQNTMLMCRVIWIMAYAADKSILPMEEWLESFSGMPVYSVYGELNEMFGQSIRGVLEKN